MEFVDIAGLVAGASKGEGLGNQFLGHIRETDAIAHVVRCFDNDDIVHVSGQVDPLRDIDIIHTELALADLDSAEKALQKAIKNSKSGQKAALLEKELLERITTHLGKGEPLRTLPLSPEEKEITKTFNFITEKKTLYVANVSEDGFTNNPYLEKVIQYAAAEGAEVVAICAEIESQLIQLPLEERTEFMKELGFEEPGLHRFIRAGYHLLDLQTYFTAGVKEVRAWTIPKGAKAPQAAGKIHSDFEKGFIRAEVIAYEDFIHYQGEKGAREGGKLRVEGKEYVVADGDVMHFLFNVSGNR